MGGSPTKYYLRGLPLTPPLALLSCGICERIAKDLYMDSGTTSVAWMTM
jgi:hypothetical protein